MQLLNYDEYNVIAYMTISKRTILIIGGGGFIGNALIKQMNLLFNLIVLEPDEKKLRALEEYGVKAINGEIKDINLIDSLIKEYRIDAIVHLASKLIPSSGFHEFQEELKDIVFPTIELIHLCSINAIKFVFISSGGTVYGDPNRKSPIKEDFTTSPISYYGLSKKIIEDAILFERREYNLQYLILRPSNAYGPGQNVFGQQGLVGVAINKVLSNEPLIIWGDGSNIRDYIYIEDLSSIITHLLIDDIINKTINISTGQGYTVNDIIDAVSIIADTCITTHYQSARHYDVSSIVLDNSLMQELVPFKLTPLRVGISKYYEFKKKMTK